MAALSMPGGADWDTKLDNMLADLETGSSNNPMMNMHQNAGNSSYNFQQQQQFSYSSSQQQISGGNIQHQQQKSFSSRSHQAVGPKVNGGSGGGYSLQKSGSSVSLKDSAGEVLKDLEDGLVKSSHFIRESHGKISGPEGTQEWHDVQRGGDPQPQNFDLEMQVQHMMPNLTSYGGSQSNQFDQQHQIQQQQQSYQQQSFQQNQYHQEQHQHHQQQRYQEQQQVQQVQEVDDRPGSRLKQNIDELDNLLYDLNHARNLSPEGGTDYTDNYGTTPAGMDSDDYSESVGKEGHVKRTVHAFNEYSAQMSSADMVKKPPSPSPRRKAPNSPGAGRRAPPGGQSYITSSQQQSSSSSYRQEMTSTTRNEYPSSQATYTPPPSINYQPSGGGQGGGYPQPEPDLPPARSPDLVQPARSPEVPQPNYYTKFSSVKQSTSSTSTDKQGMRFPTTSARSPTPQNMPKQVDELMSEFHEFDSTVSKSVSPKPMFSKPATPIVQVTGPPSDREPSLPSPAPVVRDPSPPKPIAPAPATSNIKGPGVYYPPGHEFSKQESKQAATTTVVLPAKTEGPGVEGGEEGGAVAVAGASGAAASMRMESRKEKYAREEKEATQGAAMIPICLPLCCAAPCVIM
eukprot:TRINITY_DN4667_c0_g1_i9.p1 TRINITY_DN4667_c0_g1~~TRINITY_DN4667_c0_g1_i9.p1  ORF type:complete len:627 (-),score=215.50 TRINITY_DN4667_c0_g1_i9:893-2773(-)